MTKKKILDGIKVLECAFAAAAPITTTQLAMHGATVIKVETHKRLDMLRVVPPFRGGKADINRGAVFESLNSGKYSVSLDLGKSKARDIAIKLALWADIVLDGYTPGVMKRWGLDYESLKKKKPDIIYLSTTQQGQFGPHANFMGYGWQAAALGGFYQLTGWPDRGPSQVWGAYTDFINPYHQSSLIMAALLYRHRTGKGVYIDESQFECGLKFLRPYILDYTVNGRVAKRMGNRSPHGVPHGVFRCRGEDRWVAIAVFTDEQWISFCRVIGNPEWSEDIRFTTLAERKKNEDDLERLVEQWTIKHEAEDVMQKFQAAGISAGVVETFEDLLDKDPQLRQRKAFPTIEHPETGLQIHRAPSYKMSKTPPELGPAPMLGEHNSYVLKEILGLSDAKIDDLLAEGCITTEADIV